MVHGKKVLLLSLLFCLHVFLSFSQESTKKGTVLLDSLISLENYKDANAELIDIMDDLSAPTQLDSLIDYVYYYGQIQVGLSGKEQGTSATLAFIDNLKKRADNDHTRKYISVELASFYEFLKENKKAYEATLEALEFMHKVPGKTGNELGLIENNLCVHSTRMGNISKAVEHVRKAYNHYQSDPNSKPDNMYLNASSFGNMMYYTAKYDSALLLYDRALEILPKLEPSPLNKFYRPAILKNNMAGLYGIQGRPTESINAMKSGIKDLQQFIVSDAPVKNKLDAKEFFFQLIDNLGGAYKDVENFSKARGLISYAYEQKLKNFGPNHQEVFIGKILMGQIDLALKDFDSAEMFLMEGIDMMKDSPDDLLFWQADAHFYSGLLYDNKKDYPKALKHYNIAESYFERAYQGSFDELYLDFVKHAAPFYARQGNKDKALSLSKRALDYLYTIDNSENLLYSTQNLNLAEVNFILKNYNEAIVYAEKTLEILDKGISYSANSMDSIRIELLKPSAFYIIEKCKYETTEKKTVSDLEKSYRQMNKAISILERNKSLFTHDQTLSVMIKDAENIFEFAKLLAYDLFIITNESKYLDKAISLNESALYNRLRNRLNINEDAQYNDVPIEMLQKEKALKKKINSALSEEGNYSLDNYVNAETEWANYIEEIRTKYPKYYTLKYATIQESLSNVQDLLPEQTTIVRFLFIQEVLYALVIDKHGKNLTPLDYSEIKQKLSVLEKNNEENNHSAAVLFDLYKAIWKPIAGDISTEKVIIIPEAELYNLSFESLSDMEIKNPVDYAEHCLLSKHIISYNYSLYLLDGKKSKKFYEDDFIAFAPGFDDKMKNDYEIIINDSVQIDRTYLTLLPQPYNLELAKNYSDLFSGTSFLNENSTVQIFKSSAKEHKIIHIGTHAESNNISPELSRLIFAKNINDSLNVDENSLYTYEIYNTNLSSNLAILTACETGKPTYQAGEGMISLAHAFNYAGSESILTSLWKIDELSSAKIIEFFYENLSGGMAKDEALRKAKLDYLKIAKGRTVHPEFWAGLVLIGDTSSIEISSGSSYLIWLLLGLILMIVIIIGFRKKG